MSQRVRESHLIGASFFYYRRPSAGPAAARKCSRANHSSFQRASLYLVSTWLHVSHAYPLLSYGALSIHGGVILPSRSQQECISGMNFRRVCDVPLYRRALCPDCPGTCQMLKMQERKRQYAYCIHWIDCRCIRSTLFVLNSVPYPFSPRKYIYSLYTEHVYHVHKKAA